MQNNVCSDIIFILGHALVYMFQQQQKMNSFKMLCTKYMENCEVMTSSTHLFAYSYQLFKKCFVENYENSKFHIFLPHIFLYPIYIKLSLFCSKYFTLSIDLTETLTGFLF